MKDYATGIQHVGIPTKDMDATKKFYEDLGFEAAFETVNDGARVCFLKMHNLVMEVCDKNMNTLQDEIHFLPFWDNGVRFFTIKGPNEEKIEFSQFL